MGTEATAGMMSDARFPTSAMDGVVHEEQFFPEAKQTIPLIILIREKEVLKKKMKLLIFAQ